MFQSFPLYIALHLIPYITPHDVVRCQKVCRSWHSTFTSPSLLATAVRIHYRVRKDDTLSPISAFSTISARYSALQSGIPQQELHFPLKKSRRDSYIWTLSSNLLVFQSLYYPKAILTLVYFDPTPGGRRVKVGEIELGTIPTMAVVRIKVRDDVLVVERSEERGDVAGWSNSITRYLASTECYRLDYSGDEVMATMMCTINTFEFRFIDYSHYILTDLSGRYYAAYSKVSPGVDSELRVWDVETGEIVKIVKPDGPFLSEMSLMVELIILGNKVVLVGNDKRNNNRRQWRHHQDDWGFLSHFRVFEVEDSGESPSIPVSGFVGKKRIDCPKESKILSTAFKFSGCASEDEEAALVLWEVEDTTKIPTAQHYTLAKSTSQSSPITSSLTPTYQYRLDDASYLRDNCYLASAFAVKSIEALSFAMEFTGQNDEFLDTRLLLHYLRVQHFHPSANDYGVMELDFQTRLKDRNDKSKDRKIYSANRNVHYSQRSAGMDVAGDELISVFIELTVSSRAELVVLVWDQPFELGDEVQKLCV